MNNEDLPAGWSRNTEGNFEYKMFPDEIKKMKKTDNLIFILSALNVIQFLFIIILSVSHFCNR